MARRNVKVDLPIYKQDEFISLCEKLIAKHKKLGVQSPLSDEEVKVLEEIVNIAKGFRTEAIDLHSQAESKMEKSRISLGINKGQNSNTPSTAYFHIAKLRDSLLSKYRGAEEGLSEFGFKIIISSSKSPKPKTD